MLYNKYYMHETNTIIKTLHIKTRAKFKIMNIDICLFKMYACVDGGSLLPVCARSMYLHTLVFELLGGPEVEMKRDLSRAAL